MRATSWGLVGLLLGSPLAGCDNGKSHVDPVPRPDAAVVIDAAPPPWWQPAPGTVRDWDIQVQAPFDTTAARAMYVLELWDVVPAATTLDYGDGAPVTVPAGALAGALAELAARPTPPVVICRVGTGAIRLSDPDAAKFAGAAAPADRPTAPAADSVVGWTTGDPTAPDERFLDLRADRRAAWAPLVWKRLDLARELGCDGVEATDNDSSLRDTGWTMPVTDETSWFEEVAAAAHARQLSVGMQNGTAVPSQVDVLADDFDWLIVERCGEYDDCGLTRPFLTAGKAVLALDYTTDEGGAPTSASALCANQTEGMVEADGLIKDVALTSAARTSCAP